MRCHFGEIGADNHLCLNVSVQTVKNMVRTLLLYSHEGDRPFVISKQFSKIKQK